MRAMILAAGRGERMRPLTDTRPKPLLAAGGEPLIVHLLRRLAAAGYKEIVINLAYRGEMIREALGDGAAYGAHIAYSDEGKTALETGGGLRRALPLLGDAPFLAVNADVWCDHPLYPHDPGDDLAHLVLVDNPPQHPGGDFHLQGDRVDDAGESRLTFSGIGYYRPELFAGTPDDAFPLAPLLRRAMAAGRVGGEHHRGLWLDIGTPERLADLDARLATGRAHAPHATPHRS
ncbi:N-acetylmuramate alpha-1-phosphate uridylyltransferase MurU [Acidihalobacter prosperus]|uniref:Glucose-1-phosphate thymidylyltransferase n=1 Tax=Acidihalobacter prosperus TaxID=160660 RepID=A0A1A6C6E2_9GAMM|nr:nucleotidyltransferase family protein [Acidihalobacter prosperus]OBS10126.1 Glucose-1-phosphate thymidylyltransferase [Acidihalobacter prosperus]